MDTETTQEVTVILSPNQQKNQRTRIRAKLKKEYKGLFYNAKGIETLNEKKVKKALKELFRKKPVPDIIDEKSVYTYAQQIPYLPTRVFAFTAYLTGARISEVLRLIKRDVQKKEISGKQFVIFHMINLKNRQRPYKDIPVALDTEEKQKMFSTIENYIHYMHDNSLLFPAIRRERMTMRLRRALIIPNHRFYDYKNKQVLQKDFKLYPHFIRHIRLTQIVRDYPDITAYALQYIAGWSDPRMAMIYIHTSWEQVTTMMINKFIEK